ncbi:MAG TPA: penicillin-binding protein 2, partial [Acidiferrobacteraceae bacterium]|nr:penicillin-binding protein 2 [Acidiferrobacteraceae bacterium]
MARVSIKDTDREAHLFATRVSIASVVVLLLCGILLGRLFYLQVVHYSYYATLSRQNSISPLPIQPVRGLILDRNGIVLADNFPVFSLDIVPSHVHHLPQLLHRLGGLIALNPEDLRHFQRRLHQLHPYDRVVLRNHLTAEEASRVAVNLPRLDGVQLHARLERYYPLGGLAVAAVGYVSRITGRDLLHMDRQAYAGVQHIGRLGIEARYQKLLLGTVGFKQVEINAHGRAVRVLSRTPPQAGKNIYLNLDAKMQAIAEQGMGTLAGGLVAINPQTGAVLALVSMPTYDPNPFVDGISTRAYAALRDNPLHPLINRALSGGYAPGSTIKPYYALAGLALGKLDPYAQVSCPGWYSLPGSRHIFHCWKRGGHGLVTLHDAIEESCDVYFYKLAAKLGIDDMTRYLSYFGFGRPTGIDIAGESPGLVPTQHWRIAHHEQWYPGETVVAGIGQGQLAVTPLQLANAVSAMSMYGKRFHPNLVYAIENPVTKSMRYVHAQPARPVPVKDPSDFSHVIDGMEAVIYGPHGTARVVGLNAPYVVAGKTGTAQVIRIQNNHRYENEADMPLNDRDDAIFEAFAPVGNPQIAVG